MVFGFDNQYNSVSKYNDGQACICMCHKCCNGKPLVVYSSYNVHNGWRENYCQAFFWGQYVELPAAFSVHWLFWWFGSSSTNTWRRWSRTALSSFPFCCCHWWRDRIAKSKYSYSCLKIETADASKNTIDYNAGIFLPFWAFMRIFMRMLMGTFLMTSMYFKFCFFLGIDDVFHLNDFVFIEFPQVHQFLWLVFHLTFIFKYYGIFDAYEPIQVIKRI